MDLATGEIVAYTDDDCFADEDWLYFLVAKLLETGASGVGGPNLLPDEDGPVAACVSASPGAPAHILIDDDVAEHIPGCNMAFWADRLKAIGGFDPVYTKAGDDVDVCWRLQAEGDAIVFSPAAMVWHHRRATVKAYLKQQRGYGEAEALLKRKHPEKFQGFRADLSWMGRIYTRAGLGLKVGEPVIHYGTFGTGLFQTIYAPRRSGGRCMVLASSGGSSPSSLLGLATVFNPAAALARAGVARPLGRSRPSPTRCCSSPCSCWRVTLAWPGWWPARPPRRAPAPLVVAPADRGHARGAAGRARLGPLQDPLRDHRRSPSRSTPWPGLAAARGPAARPATARAVERERRGPRGAARALLQMAAQHRWFPRVDPGWTTTTCASTATAGARPTSPPSPRTTAGAGG